MKDENENNQFNEKPGSFGLPEGYFQKSANSIMNKIEWQEEHKDFPKLIELKNENPFGVPANYFFENEEKLEFIQYPVLSALKKESGFIVPENYFENAESIELSKVLHPEENELNAFDTLNSLTRETYFTVPQNYFQNTEERLSESLTPSKPVKIIPLFSKRIGFAIAAMFIIVIAAWIYNFYFVPVAVEDCGTIACLDKQDLVKTHNLEGLDDDELFELVDPSALEKKLENTETKNNIKKNRDSSFQDLSDDELLDDI